MTIGEIATRCWTDSWKTIASVESYRPVNCPPAYVTVFVEVEVDTWTGAGAHGAGRDGQRLRHGDQSRPGRRPARGRAVQGRGLCAAAKTPSGTPRAS